MKGDRYLMLSWIKERCASLCKNLFNDSSDNCLSHISLKQKLLLLTQNSTLLKVRLTRQIQRFCHIRSNRFWKVYYTICKSKIGFTCQQCSKTILCQEYMLNKIIKHIKEYKHEKVSIVFEKVQENLITIDNHYQQQEHSLDDITQKVIIQNYNNQTQEVINHYTHKIVKEYQYKGFTFDIASAMIENIISDISNSEVRKVVEQQLLISSKKQQPIILEKFVLSSFNDNKEKATQLLLPTLIELYHKEKFTDYVKHPIKSRYLDFLKSKTYKAEMTFEDEPLDDSDTFLDKYEEEELLYLLTYLANEEKVILKLRHAMALNNQEFLTIAHQLKEVNADFIDMFTNDELFYIQLSVHHGLDETSNHYHSILGDLEKIKQSISKKISNYRENFTPKSYDTNSTQEEIMLKLIYTEPLSAQEIGFLFGLTNNEVYRSLEKSKRKLQKLEREL